MATLGARSATSHGTSVAADLPRCRSLPGAQNTGFAGYSRQAGPVRPVYNTDQPITALKGTGIRTVGPGRDGVARFPAALEDLFCHSSKPITFGLCSSRSVSVLGSPASPKIA